MCGIAGIIEFRKDTAEDGLIRRMTDAMSHRGPDSDGFYNDKGISLGHRRLSIIDLSSAANQPFIDNSGRYVMVFNGEMYNYAEVKGLIKEYEFRTAGDTEVLMAAYIKWGPDCIRYFRGMFAFAVWDREKKEVFIARDRMGVKPFYYFLSDDRLIFASEIRSILATGLVKRKVDTQALLEYFTYQSVSSPLSIIEHIQQLEAGTWMKIKEGKAERHRYWDVTKACSDFDFEDKDAVRGKIRALLLQSVRRRLVSDVPVGAFLSGGIDSSAVVGLMAEASDAPPNTFNIAFEEKDYDESKYAEIIAKKFGTVHTRLLLKPTIFLDDLENALDSLDTPTGDGINTYVVSKAIRQKGVTVALSGVGGDELFAGYPFFSQYLNLHKGHLLWKVPAGIRKGVATIFPTGPANGKKGRIKQLFGGESWFIDKSYPVFRQILSPGFLREITTLYPSGDFTTAVQQQLSDAKEQLERLPFLSQVSAAEYLGYTQHTLLKDTDQMSMAVSLEVREPFFDHDLVEFVMAVPDALKKPIYPKSLLVESLKPLLPDEIVFRKKQGFLFPWNLWLKDELRSFCDQRIRNMAQRPFINGEKLLTWWQQFLDGDPHIRWAEIWLFIVLEYWLEKNNVD
ncbi:MAG TPA: asparagine synthase (glutamine-hydrolyzing) [Puia sp.]|nr:asparagine synthase (glutamine-hydrolyzing) [Puia sp.]